MPADRGASPVLDHASPRSPIAGAVELVAWELIRSDSKSIEQPEDLAFATESWLAAAAPGTVAGALSNAGRWDWKSTLDLDNHDWWYRCHFRCDDFHAGASLKFAGLASLADVWLNGSHVLSSDNMFVGHTVDISDSVRRDNELVIRFRSLAAELSVRRTRPRWRTRLASHQNLRWIRTTLLGRMPGWSSVAQPVGPWKSVSLVPHAAARLVSRKLHARLDGTDGVVEIFARVHAPPGVEASSSVVTVGTIERSAILRRSGDELIISASIRIPSAKAWWPHTHGDQPLYDVGMTLVLGDETVRLPLGRIAFRNFELESGKSEFRLLVNGENVFWRGACWSPPDVLRLHASTNEYRRTLELARDAGMNMLRVGGTMVYEHDAFYDLCDELGIVVWQDLMFANMDYPADDDAFVASVELEVRQFLQRAGNHASLALICGNSEVEQQAAMLGLPASAWRSSLFAERFARLIAEHAPGIPYWPSSPSGGILPFHVNAGDAHYYGYGPYLRSASDVRASEVRFASECLALSNIPEPDCVDRMSCGTAGAGHHPEWKRGVPRDNGAGWDFEDVRDHYVKETFGVDPAVVRYGDPERYLALGRVAGGELMARTIAEWRRTGSTCGGALVWLFRDLRPGAGWGVLDYDGAPKAAYYYLARAFRPVTVSITDEGLNGIHIHTTNDSASPLAAELKLSLYNGSAIVTSVSTRLAMNARSSVSTAAEQLLGAFTDVSYAYRFGRANHDAVVATLVNQETGTVISEAFHFPLGIGSLRGATRLGTRIETLGPDSYALTIAADELALAVAIEATGWKLSDNYFHIAAGSERTVLLTAGRGASRLNGRVTALNGQVSTGFRT
jgi:beta-mannosidase